MTTRAGTSNPQTLARTAGPVRSGDADAASFSLGDLVLIFRHHQTQLAAGERAELQRWVGSWLRAGQACTLLAGCCCDTTRAERRLRQAELRAHLVNAGVPHQAIRWTEEWFAPALPELSADLLPDVVWLHVALTPGPASTEETACTSAS